MKKYIFLFALGLTASVAQSQEISDALRYSQDDLNGTARFRAMSGAFGALGGDLSSIYVNPAGSAVFLNNQMGLTLSSFNIKNNSNYFGTKTSDKENSIDLNQAGAVFVFNNRKDSDWRKISLGVNYEKTNDFTNRVFSAGTNPTNSIDKYFLSYANTGNNGAPVPQQFVNREAGESISDLYSYLGSNLPNNQYPSLNGFAAQQAMIAFYNQGFVIDADDVNNPNSTYSSLIPAGGNY
ncbi:MAG TPA: transporter, partial [Flavobacterium sp.]|nr:transporter [Flavobacterium sp.]